MADLATARYGVASSPSGTSSLALATGGYTTTQVSNTEEWSFPAPTTSVLTEGRMWFNNGLKGYGKSTPAGTWASGGTLNVNRESWAGASGTQTASITFGGYNGTPSPNADTETYNGTSWTEVNNLNTARHGNG